MLAAKDSNRRRFLAPPTSMEGLIPFVVDLFVFVVSTVSLSEELAIVAKNASIYKLIRTQLRRHKELYTHVRAYPSPSIALDPILHYQRTTD